MDTTKIEHYINSCWDDSIVPSLCDYIKIPNKSPLFDSEWESKGYMAEAVSLIGKWCKENAPKGMEMEVLTLPGRTPLIYMDIPGEGDDPILLYGHLDKQPEMVGWHEGLGPWEPVLKEGKLYGRGGADDGYAAFASITAINALQAQGIPHARCLIIIEASEESGSVDLPFYIDMLKEKMPEPSLVICLDSGCGNYDQLWMTTSLRGNIVGELTAEISAEGVHSGNASGIVPDTFRILRQLLSRIESDATGEICLPELKGNIPAYRIDEAKKSAEVLGDEVYEAFPFIDEANPVTKDLVEAILNRTWRAQLTVTGAEGLPDLGDAGNVLRPKTALKLSMRTPPNCNIDNAIKSLHKTLTESPPYNARVTFTCDDGAEGWHAPKLSPWLSEACREASNIYFGGEAQYMGEGGSIPFMGMLGEKFPKAQFMITGVLGPMSNAHGPNEFLHIEMGKKVTACVSHVIAKQNAQ
jgi:acetylornithine deacetylase/succinyl-diaminopimelate desuccinylase-like protein